MSIDRSLQRTCAFASPVISTSGYIRVIDIFFFANISTKSGRDRPAKESSARFLPGSSADDDLSALIMYTLIDIPAID